MYIAYPAGLDRVFQVAFVDGQGDAVIPALANFVLYDEDYSPIVTQTNISLVAEATTANVTIGAASNQIEAGKIRGFRTLTVDFEDSLGNQYVQTIHYILEANNLLQVGVNSFASAGKFAMLLLDMPSLSEAQVASDAELTSAIINAYYNIGNLHLDFSPYEIEFASSMELTEALIATLPESVTLKLCRATLIEADSILGGNPVEDRRRMGLMSHSAGESAHFFRPQRPLDLPVCKNAARELTPMVRHVMRIGR